MGGRGQDEGEGDGDGFGQHEQEEKGPALDPGAVSSSHAAAVVVWSMREWLCGGGAVERELRQSSLLQSSAADDVGLPSCLFS